MTDDVENDPIHLVEDEGTGDRFLVYGEKGGARLEIKFAGETLWMTQAQIAELFGRERSVISKHIANVFADKELDEQSNVQKLHIAPSTKPVSTYSLDLIISVGYRVSSKQATLFRRWATQILVQYAKNGFVVDRIRLKAKGNQDRLKELREIVREIRADEANLYAELRAICALCQDYDPSSQEALKFFQHTQAKLIFAVCSQTPSEVIFDRSDPSAPNMGLQTWQNENIRKSDIKVAKNYLTEVEIRELNRLTDILLSIFEDQADQGRLMLMSQATDLLHKQLTGLGRVVLKDGGSVTAKKAQDAAAGRYDDFNSRRLEHERAGFEALAKEIKKLR